MTEKELKRLIKPLIRECLTEIFAEMQLEKIVENVVAKKNPQLNKTVSATQSQSIPRFSIERPKINESSLRKKLNISKEEWDNVYGNIDTKALTEQSKTDRQVIEEGTEGVPEEALESIGILKDYSKFI